MALGLFFLSLVSNRKVIFRVAEDKRRPGKAEPLFLEQGKSKILKVDVESFKDYLLNLLTGKTNELKRSKYQYPGQVYLEKEEIIAGQKYRSVFYIPEVENIPKDIRVFDLLAYFHGLSKTTGKNLVESLNDNGTANLLKQRFWKLDKVEILRILLASASFEEVEIYLLYDLSRKMPGEGLILIKDKLEELSGKGAVVIFIITESIINDICRITNKYYSELDGKWSGQVEEIRRLIEHEKTVKKND